MSKTFLGSLGQPEISPASALALSPRKGAHAARKFHPNGVVCRHVRKPGRTAVSHDGGRIAQKIIQYFRCGGEFDGRAHIGWRIAIEEHSGRGCHSVLSALLRQETMHHEVVAQDAHSTLRGACRRRQQCCRFALADMSKEIELDGRPDRCCLSACKQRIDHEFGRHYASMGVVNNCFHGIPQSPRPILPGNASSRNYAYIRIFYNTHPLTLSGDRAELLCRSPPALFEMLVLAELPRCSLGAKEPCGMPQKVGPTLCPAQVKATLSCRQIIANQPVNGCPFH